MKNIIKGALIGIANIVPGVSGGTMAVILKIYDKLIYSISNLRKDFINSIKFLIPIGVGGALGIVLFSKVIEYSLENYTLITNFVFIGLILGSIPLIYRKTIETSGIKIKMIVLFLVSLCVMMYMKSYTDVGSVNIIREVTLVNAIKMFVTGIISAGTMIIPGVSGSLVMLIIGMYASITDAISTFNIPMLIIFGLGAIAGILLFSKIINWLFEKRTCEIYSIILGLMIGSVYVLIPKVDINIEFVVALVFLVVSTIVAYKFSK